MYGAAVHSRPALCCSAAGTAPDMSGFSFDCGGTGGKRTLGDGMSAGQWKERRVVDVRRRLIWSWLPKYFAWYHLRCPGCAGSITPENSHKRNIWDVLHVSDVGCIAVFNGMRNERDATMSSDEGPVGSRKVSSQELQHSHG
uniref:Uncharacterized protein n=1 Tax=Ascaris lumbricoides TaxID=6252 RepID=A0A0M3I5X6_ASCLU